MRASFADACTGQRRESVPLATSNKIIALRLKSNFSRRIKLICPVQSCLQKYSALVSAQITHMSFAIPLLHEGRFAIVTDVGRDAVDAGGATDESAYLRTAKSCGPDAPTLASSSREASFLHVSWG